MKLTKAFAAILALVLAGSFSLSAQTRQVSGTVLDTQQQPVIGAAVMTSATNGTMTGSAAWTS